MLAVVRPDSWNLPLFLHVLGATVVFGTTATLAIVGVASRVRTDNRPLLARVAFRTFLFGILPAWILMRIAAEWIAGKEFPDGADTPGWVDLGYIVSDGSGVLLLVTGILAWLSARRGRLMLAVPLLATVVVIGFGIAWVWMSGKP
jgi:hypothetical protein